MFRSEIGSGFEDPGGTPPPRIPRSTPPGRPVDKTNITSKPTTVSEHFLSQPNHCHTDMQLIPLEVIHSSRDSIRKARESFLIDLAGTLEPHGLNRRDEL